MNLYMVTFEDGATRHSIQVHAKTADDAMAQIKTDYPAALIVAVVVKKEAT
jgi:hypothetical protein